MLICVVKLKLYVLLRLCLIEVSVYVKHASVWEMINEGVSMTRIQCYESDDLCEKYAHTLTLWMN